MSLTKHKLFLIPIKDGEIDTSSKVLKEIDKFLEDENYVYVNHSITTLSRDEATSTDSNLTHPQYVKFKTSNTYCIISLIYQDLKGTRHDITNLSNKSKQVVTKAIKSSQKYPKPDFSN
jgi:hypothetical protein